MVEKIIHTVLAKRHFWRQVSFNELSELYASMFLRSLALSLIGVFVPIFLYKSGFSVQAVLGYYAVFCLVRAPVDIATAYIVGRIGPKHTLALSTLANIVHLTMLLSLKELGWPLPFLAIIGTWTNSLFFIAFHTDFSKIKHPKHGGKEIGYMLVIERIGGVLGPLIGGLLATYADPSYTIMAAIVLFAVSMVPLLATNEPVVTHQRIDFTGLPLRRMKRYVVAHAAQNTENTVSVLLWVFFVSLTVFKENTYAKIGAVTALSTLTSIFFAKYIGKKLDQRKGKRIFLASVGVNSVLHLVRPLVSMPLHVIGVNLINDPITVAYRMPFMKSFYDAADSLPGKRIVFIAALEAGSAITRGIFWGGLFVASLAFDPITVMKIGFLCTACFGLAIALQPQTPNNHK